MNDAEIIKALPQITYGGRCTKCKYGIYSGDDRCGIKGCKIARDALDLIRRQQADIERLKSSEPTEEMRAKCEEVINKIRAEAIKDFADALKSKSELVAPSVYAVPYRAVSVEDIDKFVKIAGGEDNES